MTHVTLTQDQSGFKAGDIIEVTPGAAEYLIGAGVAEESKSTRKTTAKVAVKPATDEVGGTSLSEKSQPAG